MTKRFGNYTPHLWITSLCLLMLSALSHAGIEAYLDRTQLALGDIVTFTISSDGSNDLKQIDLAPLEQNFEVLGQSSSSNTQIVNGAMSRSVTLRLDITPKRQGNLQIPTLQAGSDRTQAINVKVGPPVVATNGDATLNFRAEVNQGAVYVQGQLHLTVTIERAINLDDLNVSELNIENAYVHTLEQQTFQRTIAGKPWIIHELRYAIFPERSGTLTIPSLRLSGREIVGGGGLFSRSRSGRLLTRNTEPLIIEVKPIPYNYPNDAPWLVAERITLNDSLDAVTEITAGQALTRTIKLSGQGVQGVQLPPIAQQLPDQLKTYPDQPIIRDQESRDNLQAERIESTAIIASEPGNITLPEIRVMFWNSKTNALDNAVLPSRTLQVQPRADQTPNGERPRDAFVMGPPPARDANPSEVLAFDETTLVEQDKAKLWRWVSAALAVIWLITLIWALHSRKQGVARPTSQPNNLSTNSPLQSAINAARNNDAGTCIQQLHRLTKDISAEQPGLTLEALGKAINSAELDQAIQVLLASRYGTNPQAWKGNKLAQLLRDKRQSLQDLQLQGQNKGALTLYPM
ncbi:MAG: BatD family protein [Halieaceae bacterium]|nr:BatD family protein [Halieaceae bacterium]